jgi:hypothetical protein
MLTYVLPIKVDAPAQELTSYLAWLAPRAQVVVVDGSDPAVFTQHHRQWSSYVEHVPVDPDLVTPMGKVGGVLTGLRRASHSKMVVADDDVRYSDETLEAMEQLLPYAELVRPQNYFNRRPWHARWDTARSLIARATGADWPGTFGIDRDALRAAGGYRGDVMFENLELVRTFQAQGCRVLVADDLFVERTPPTTRQFFRQRVRQAYDELARPARLAVSLALLPLLVIGGVPAILALAFLGVLLAEYGRRRCGGRAVFEPTAALWAPFWIAERAVTVWLALGQRLLGGVRYGGTRLKTAASSRRVLRQQLASASPATRGVWHPNRMPTDLPGGEA